MAEHPLWIERLTDEDLHREHLAALNKLVMKLDWPTVDQTDPLRVRVDLLGSEMRLRMDAE